MSYPRRGYRGTKRKDRKWLYKIAYRLYLLYTKDSKFSSRADILKDIQWLEKAIKSQYGLEFYHRVWRITCAMITTPNNIFDKTFPPVYS